MLPSKAKALHSHSGFHFLIPHFNLISTKSNNKRERETAREFSPLLSPARASATPIGCSTNPSSILFFTGFCAISVRVLGEMLGMFFIIFKTQIVNRSKSDS